ncbi:FAD-dependent monooxygenase [Amorphus orientalis]|uniref:2-polyprenyl-6-methoxyphenol hydroxylase-like FAD-dependent oxidoreductase n=1 Tax=Amorphus orientalis TaxID=649198 RepID=A0AAE3VQW7_9HYPH|nr:FAD-dependent monooxygenase [Amorphus orientalis]MDQ0316492.1 2-polyprenyl-6-methoxyphenol hydroxylase-like FAD-dependent oxidoreductase [Amorphus orientalis]
MTPTIIGAGIGGLTAALFLHKHGIQSRIFERAPDIQELGVGINLLPHAVATFAEIGILDRLVEEGICPEHLYYRTRFGQTVWDEPRGLKADLKVPQVSVHRGRLQRVLYDAVLDRLPAGAVSLDRRFESYEETGAGVTARFETGAGEIETVETDMLIGADGIHSRLRTLLYPDEGRARWSGRIMYRGTADWPIYDGGRTFIISGGNDARLVLFPIAKGKTDETLLTNWVLACRVADDGAPLETRPSWHDKAVREDALKALSQFTLPELDIVALGEASDDIWESPMCDRDPLPQWRFGRVTLLGDAAHPMYPFGGNGAAQAVLDAKALAQALDGAASVEAGLDAYEAARREAVYQVVLNNRQGGPERVIDAVQDKVDGVVDDIDAVVPFAEREAIVRGYSRLAGFSKEQLTPA